MLKIFVTGDIHIGKLYDRYPEIKETLIDARFRCLERCVGKAETEHCDLFVITGDLFDNNARIRQRDTRQVVGILSGFSGRVLIIPGNHDYYTGEEKLWRDFDAALAGAENNIVLLNEFRPYVFDVGEESVSVYPAYCQSRHSHENNLAWIRDSSFDDSDYHVGLAHGSLEGVSPDENREYFPMTEKELLSVPVDAWFIGHTHVPYPSDIGENEETCGYRIFNAGTPQQTDLSTNTPGKCFIVSLDKRSGKTEVSARSFISGDIFFYDLTADTGGRGLRETVEEAVRGLPQRSVIRLKLSGPANAEEYEARKKICDEILSRFLTEETEMSSLYEVITKERIRADFAEIGFAASFLEALDDPKELQLAYGLIRKYQQTKEGEA